MAKRLTTANSLLKPSAEGFGPVTGSGPAGSIPPGPPSDHRGGHHGDVASACCFTTWSIPETPTTLAISLGTQQLIRDISDGFSLFLDGQLKVADNCTSGTPKSGKIDGAVLSMGIRSICLRLNNGSQLSMPNSQVAGSVVTNHSLRSAEPLELRLSIAKLESQALADLQSRF